MKNRAPWFYGMCATIFRDLKCCNSWYQLAHVQSEGCIKIVGDYLPSLSSHVYTLFIFTRLAVLFVRRHIQIVYNCKFNVVCLSENPYLILADGYVIRSYEMARDSNDRPSFLSYSDSISRIDSVAVDLTGKQWSAYLLSYHSKAILQADITSLKRVAGKTSRLSKRQSSTAVKPQSISQFRQLVSAK